MATFTLNDATDAGVTPRKGFPDADSRQRHARALDGFKASTAYFSEQRRREIEDLKFVDFDEQWDATVKTQRGGNQAVNGLPPTPPRPMITINQLRGPIQQLANTRRAARLGLEFAPKGGGSSQQVADVYEDIVRALQAESRAAIARNWAADRAEKAGLGWYRIDTEYSQDTPTDRGAWNDQEIVWRRILNQGSVFPDPNAQEPDFSDGRRWYVTEDLPIEVYRERFKDSDLAAYESGELTAVGNAQPKWVFTASEGADGEAAQTVRIAECWEVVEEEKTLVMLTDGTAAYEQDIPEGKTIQTGADARRRRKKTRCLYWSLINAVEYLERPREVNGVLVPLIPCIGEESNVDGERRWRGIVRPGKESAVSYNVMRSALIEAIATASKAPYIAYARVIGKYMEWWKQGPSRNFPFLPIDEAYDKSGSLLPPPARTNSLDAGVIQATSLAAQTAKDDVHTTTGVPPVALGQLDPHDRSGKAIAALQGQAEVGSSGYMDNFVSITLAYEGKVVRDLIRHIYDRPGRIVPALGSDEKRRLVMLNAPYVEGPDGMPMMVPNWQPGQPIPKELPGPPSPDGQPSLPLKVHYLDMVGGEYSVAPVAGKSYATRREEAAAAIGDVLRSVPPEMAMVMAPAWIEAQDWPDAKKIAEIAKNALPPPLRSAYEDEQAGALPPQVKAQIEQLTQENQQLKQLVQSKAAEKQAEAQAKGQIDLAKADKDNQTRIQVAEIGANAGIAEADIKTANADLDRRLKLIELFLTAEQERRLDRESRAHEHVQQSADRAHDVAMEAVKHANALEAGQQAHDQALEAGAAGHQQTLEQGQQAADLAPQPETGA